MRKVCERIALVVVLVGVLGTLPFQAVAETVGSVISTTGEAYAEGPSGQRPLECATPVELGETLVTPDGARAALLAGDVYLQLDGGSAVAIRRGADGAPAFDVLRGRVRILDTRESGPALAAKTAGALASGTGTDTEIRIDTGGAQFCESAASLALQTGSGASATLASGQCVTVSPDGSTANSDKPAEEIKLAGAEGCFDVALVDHFTPGVSAPAAPTISLAPIDPDRSPLDPCDTPGSGCGRIVSFIPPPPGGEIMEQPPEPPTGCFPGAPPGACGGDVD
jgi:hypothetical protein